MLRGKLKKSAVVVLSLVLSLTMFTTTVGAAQLGATKSKSMIGSSSTTGFSCTLTWKGGGLTGAKFDGTSYTKWLGSSPYNADKITHSNIITTTNIGGVSVGNDGGSVSINGGTITDKFSKKNTWKINTNYNYNVSGLILFAKFQTSARVQFGSTFYTWSTD